MKPKQETLNALTICNYFDKAELNLKIKDANSGNIEIKPIEVTLRKPAKVEIKQVNIRNNKIWSSCCVIPGQDPERGDMQQCLDNCIRLSDEKSILLALFDGHGKHGKQVVSFCCEFTSRFFESQKDLITVIYI